MEGDYGRARARLLAERRSAIWLARLHRAGHRADGFHRRVDGQAWGHGAELAWACDLRVASARATFGQPEVSVGVCPGSGGTVRLARLFGEAACLRLVLDARPVDGREAHRLGLVHELVDPGRALETALAWAARLAASPPWALEACKRAVKGARDLPFAEALRHEGGTFIELLSRPDTIALLRATQERYDRGADAYEAFGVAEPGAVTI